MFFLFDPDREGYWQNVYSKYWKDILLLLKQVWEEPAEAWQGPEKFQVGKGKGIIKQDKF